MNKIIESAVSWARSIATDNSHGYSQASRWGPDYDCSSLVISAFEQAGLPLRANGAGNTATMRGPFLRCGFTDVTLQVGLNSGYGLQPGDVLLNYTNHTCLYIGEGKVVNARTDEGNPRTGDQSGNEIRIQPYWNFPWNCVLRYKGTETEALTKPDATPASTDHSLRLPLCRTGSRGPAVSLLQAALTLRHYDCGAIDGDFGPRTRSALMDMQKDRSLTVDGVCGPDTWRILLRLEEENK